MSGAVDDARRAVSVAVDAVTRALDEGGQVAAPLFVIFVVLAFALGERAALLRRGTRRSTRELVDGMCARIACGAPPLRPFVPSLFVAAVSALEARLVVASARPHDARADALRLALAPLLDMYGRHGVLTRTLVVIAPLMGLLGTVSGMIETFDSLATMTLHAGQSGGIAGGISEALVSTELGLLVAVPGLLIGRLLDRTERTRRDELSAMVDLLVLAHENGDGIGVKTGGA